MSRNVANGTDWVNDPTTNVNYHKEKTLGKGGFSKGLELD